ncbi:MAG: VapE family protein [Bosea sp. (in: a-proteobacteria)]|nr:VapE family protein [Bosea sp. (in: a-proteobacteria)]
MTTTQQDTSSEFQATLRAWDNMKKPTDDEVAALIACAEKARHASDLAGPWATLARHLVELGGFSKDAAQKEASRCRIVAALGRYPEGYDDFVALWLDARGYSMKHSGEFLGPRGVPVCLDHVLNQMKVWTEDKRVFKGAYEAALRLWTADERLKIIERTYGDLVFDAAADPDMNELKRWIDLIVREDEDAEITERNKRGVLVAVTNFIHRVKNHLGAMVGIEHPSGDARWHHHTHVMPVLYGAQEDGKTLAVKTLLRAVSDLATGMGFEVLEDNSKQNMLSYMPVMSFDELAGLKNANVEKLKGIMTEETRSMRDVYERAGPKRVVTTFIGCTNEDLNGLVRDKTGNRRFFQFATKLVDVAAMRSIDARRIWRSVDENAVSPWYANAEDLQIVKAIQAEQRHKSSVHDWIENCSTLPTGGGGWVTTSELYRSYFAYIEEFYRSEVNGANVGKFGRELNRLFGARHPQIEQNYNTKTKSNQYRIARPGAVKRSKPKPAASLPVAANTNTIAETIRHDDLGFPVMTIVETLPETTMPTSPTKRPEALLRMDEIARKRSA